MTVSRFVGSATIRLFGVAAVVGAAVFWFGATGGAALAQTGVAGPPEVTVDLDVLNSLDHAQAPRHRDVTLHHPGERTVATPERKPERAAAKKPSRPAKKAAVKPARPVKRAAVKELHRTADRDELREDEDQAARDDAIWEADRKHEEADRKRGQADREHEEMARIKREEAERMRQAKAEIEEAARGAAPAPAPVKSASELPNPGPGPDTPPEPKPTKPTTQSGQIAAVSPPPASPLQMPPPAPVKPKPAALEKSAPTAMPHVDFAVGAADLTPEARSALDAIAKTLGSDENKRVQLVAYATGAADEANQARRLSLSRALNVRAYLIDHGVRNTRMDVRALGNRPDGSKPVDRVDIVFLDK